MKTKKKRRRFTIADLKKAAIKRGGKCLSKIYLTRETPVLWECKKKHRWEAGWGNVDRGGAWCPECSGKKKHTIEEMQEAAKLKGGKCLSKKYINNHTKLKWECAEGHQWMSPGSSVYASGYWCRKCADHQISLNQKYDIKVFQKMAEKKGGRLLTKIYEAARSPMLWQCKNGHKWEAAADRILNGYWCRVCEGRNRLVDGKVDINIIRKTIEKRKGKLLSTKYINNRTPMLIECDKGHKWKTTSANILSGTWCRKCFDTAGGRKRK